MSIIRAFKTRLSFRVAVVLAIPLLLLMVAAAVWVTLNQSRMMRELTLEKARVAAKVGARFYGIVLEDAVDDGILTIQDVFDRDYRVIEGFDWGEHPKYHTKYDFYTDHAVLLFQDEFLGHPDFVFALGQDENGYIPTHNTVYQKPITGDPAKDLVGNRSKRIFDDEVGLAAGRNQDQETLTQVYHRDTGVTMWDVSAPITVKGKHWGGFRLAVSMERVAARERNLLLLLGGIFLVLIVTAVATIFWLTARAMGPVERLTQAADAISLGDGLHEPIVAESEDEIGRLAQSLERLRVSMKAAMDRLGE